jgi:hypothetical protein
VVLVFEILLTKRHANQPIANPVKNLNINLAPYRAVLISTAFQS